MPVEIGKKSFRLEEYCVQLVPVMFKERRFSVGRLDCPPVIVLPFQTVVYPDVLETDLSVFLGQRNDQHARTPGGVEMASIAITLLYIMFVLFEDNLVKRKQRTKIFEGGEVVGFNQPNLHSGKIKKRDWPLAIGVKISKPLPGHDGFAS